MFDVKHCHRPAAYSEAFVGKRAGQRLMAIVAEGVRGRVYLPPTSEMEAVARSAEPVWRPEVEMNQKEQSRQRARLRFQVLA